MFFLTKRIDEKQCTLGEVCMTLASFSGIPSGTKGVVTEIYHEGVMVTWSMDGKSTDDIAAALRDGTLSAARGFLSDGFSRDELEYLAFATSKHPKVDPEVHNIMK
jgi:hypothetical protein